MTYLVALPALPVPDIVWDGLRGGLVAAKEIGDDLSAMCGAGERGLLTGAVEVGARPELLGGGGGGHGAGGRDGRWAEGRGILEKRRRREKREDLAGQNRILC